MCGLAASFAYHYASPVVDPDTVRARLRAMRHRGPDGEAVWSSLDRRVVFGHRRLSVIDLHPRASQPMRSDDRAIVVCLNGEIYNFRRLREELAGEGHRFHTQSDTEVVIHLYQRYGIDMLERLRGMFALALWDAHLDRLWLARDPYGIKPLYYRDDGWQVDVASTVRGLQAVKPSTTIDPAAAAGFYLFGSVPEPHSVYRDIRAVPAGHAVGFDSHGMQAPVCFADVGHAIAADDSEQVNSSDAAASVVHDAVDASVVAHMEADVPLGIFLSAGIDSAVLAAHAARRVPQLHTMTLRFEEQIGSVNDEGPLARQIAQRLGTRHTEHTVSAADYRNSIDSVLDSMDQPSLDGINTWFVSRIAQGLGIKAVLSGIGGDELFGGYPSFHDIPRWRRIGNLVRCLPGLGRGSRRLATALGLDQYVAPKRLSALELSQRWGSAYLLKRGVFMPWELPQLMGAEQAREGLRLLGLNQLLAPAERAGATPFARISALESTLYLRHQLLRDADWAGMAHGIEIRTPFVDWHLVNRLAATRDARARTGKALLLHHLGETLPPAVMTRAKTGFSPPMSDWLRAVDGVSEDAKARHHWARQFVVNVGRRFALV